MLCLLILFGIVGILLVKINVVTHEKAEVTSKKQDETRAFNDYMTSKIREHNQCYPIEIRTIEENQVLVLDNQNTYETYIYCLNQKLYEANIEKGNPFALDKGDYVMDLEEVSFHYNEGCLMIQFTTKNKVTHELLFQGGVS